MFRRPFIALSVATTLAFASLSATAQQAASLLNVSLDASATGSADILEAHIGAGEFREKAFKEGETLVLTPRKA